MPCDCPEWTRSFPGFTWQALESLFDDSNRNYPWPELFAAVQQRLTELGGRDPFNFPYYGTDTPVPGVLTEQGAKLDTLVLELDRKLVSGQFPALPLWRMTGVDWDECRKWLFRQRSEIGAMIGEYSGNVPPQYADAEMLNFVLLCRDILNMLGEQEASWTPLPSSMDDWTPVTVVNGVRGEILETKYWRPFSITVPGVSLLEGLQLIPLGSSEGGGPLVPPIGSFVSGSPPGFAWDSTPRLDCTLFTPQTWPGGAGCDQRYVYDWYPPVGYAIEGGVCPAWTLPVEPFLRCCYWVPYLALITKMRFTVTLKASHLLCRPIDVKVSGVWENSAEFGFSEITPASVVIPPGEEVEVEIEAQLTNLGNLEGQPALWGWEYAVTPDYFTRGLSLAGVEIDAGNKTFCTTGLNAAEGKPCNVICWVDCDE